MTASFAVCDVFDGLASLESWGSVLPASLKGDVPGQPEALPQDVSELARQRVGMFLEERVVSGG